MGFLDHLFKPKPSEEKGGAGKESVETPPPGPKSDPGAFLQPKEYIPRPSGIAEVPSLRGSMVAGRKAGANGARQEIVVTLGDVLARIPTQLLQAGMLDARRELRFSIDDLSADIARGRAAVPLSKIAALCPEIFAREIAPADDIEIRLPLQKLVEQIGLLRGVAPAAARPITLSVVPPALRGPMAEPPESADEEKIQLHLTAILPGCPREIITGSLPPIAEGVRVALPYAAIEKQFSQDRVVVSAKTFVAALPRSLQPFFEPREGVEVPLPIEEILQNLPGPAEPVRPSVKAPEDAASLEEADAQVKLAEWLSRGDASTLVDEPAPALATDDVLAPAVESPADKPAPEPSEKSAVEPPAEQSAEPEVAKAAEAILPASAKEVIAPITEPSEAVAEKSEPPVAAAPPAAVVDLAESPAPAASKGVAAEDAPPVPVEKPAAPAPVAVPPPPVIVAAPSALPSAKQFASPPAPPAEKPEPAQVPSMLSTARFVNPPPFVRPVLVQPPPIFAAMPPAASTLSHGEAAPPVAPPQPIVAARPASRETPPNEIPSTSTYNALQALFMTEESLDLAGVCRHAARLPGVQGCAIVLREARVAAGALPDGLDLENLPATVRRLAEAARTAAGEVFLGPWQSFALHGEQATLSFFTQPGLVLAVLHRPLPPGVGERLVTVAAELGRH